MPRTLVYCKTTKECGQLFCFFINELKEDVYINSGRAGRDREKAVSALFFQRKHLKKCDKGVKAYVKANTCLRNILLEEFEEEVTGGNHSCCLSCHLNCHCSSEEM